MGVKYFQNLIKWFYHRFIAHVNTYHRKGYVMPKAIEPLVSLTALYHAGTDKLYKCMI